MNRPPHPVSYRYLRVILRPPTRRFPRSRLAERPAGRGNAGAKKPFVLATFVFFTLFPLVLLYSRSFEWLIAAFVLRGLKEFGEPTRKSLIMDLSPDHCKAGMFGLYYLIRDVVVSLAALGGAFLWQVSPEANLIAAFVFGVIGTAGFAVFGRDIPVQGVDRETR